MDICFLNAFLSVFQDACSRIIIMTFPRIKICLDPASSKRLWPVRPWKQASTTPLHAYTYKVADTSRQSLLQFHCLKIRWSTLSKLHKVYLSQDFKALNLRKGRLGSTAAVSWATKGTGLSVGLIDWQDTRTNRQTAFQISKRSESGYEAGNKKGHFFECSSSRATITFFLGKIFRSQVDLVIFCMPASRSALSKFKGRTALSYTSGTLCNGF